MKIFAIIVGLSVLYSEDKNDTNMCMACVIFVRPATYKIKAAHSSARCCYVYEHYS